jgi:type IV pilus assembly protein PilA
MLHKLRRRAEEEKGFTLIELLVVILIIGILAAIAIPTFLNQKSKANDASAESLARNAATAMETYATTNNGSYTNASVGALNTISPALNTDSTKGAYLSAASGDATSYTVTALSPNDSPVETFVLSNVNGTNTFSCQPAGKGACSAASTW